MFWNMRQLDPTDLCVGPCAWDARLILDESKLTLLAAHPSLICVPCDLSDQELECVGSRLARLPGHSLMLTVREPAFTRQLPSLLEEKRRRLGCAWVDVLCLWIEEEATGLKSGASLQVLGEWRQKGLARWLGLGHPDVRELEWIARHTPVRLLQIPHCLQDQSAQYRLLATAEEFGMVCVGQPGEWDDPSLRFALGMHQKVLPTIDRLDWLSTEPALEPMNPQELAQAWLDYSRSCPPPSPLASGRPEPD